MTSPLRIASYIISALFLLMQVLSMWLYGFEDLLKSCLFTCSIALLAICAKKDETTGFSFSLLTLFAFIVFCLINSKDIPVSVVQVICTGTVAFISGKNCRRSPLTLIFLPSSIFQSILVILQELNIIKSISYYFQSTGTFANPTPTAIIITVGLVSLVSEIHSGKLPLLRKEHKYLAFFVISLLLSSVVICGSRACILSICVIVLILFLNRKSSGKIVAICCVAGTFLCIGYLLYLARPGSADVRLLIWRSTLNLFFGSPLTGIGTGNLSSMYMFSQAEFFMTKIGWDRFSMVANNHYQAYNEVLHFLCEQGITGFSLMALSIYLCYKHLEKSDRMVLLCLLFISLFNNTSDMYLVWFSFWLVCGRENSRITVPQWTIKMASVVCVFICILIFTHYRKARESAINWVSGEVEYFRTIKEDVSLNSNLCYKIENTYIDDLDALSIYEELANDKPTYNKFCHLGKMHRAIGQYDIAEQNYLLAFHMIPSRITALKQLFEMFLEIGDNEKAREYAAMIVYKPVRKSSGLEIQTKRMAEDFLEEQSPGAGIKYGGSVDVWQE